MSKRTTPTKVNESEQVVVFAPEFLGNMSALVNEMIQTDEGKK